MYRYGPVTKSKLSYVRDIGAVSGDDSCQVKVLSPDGKHRPTSAGCRTEEEFCLFYFLSVVIECTTIHTDLYTRKVWYEFRLWSQKVWWQSERRSQKV